MKTTQTSTSSNDDNNGLQAARIVWRPFQPSLWPSLQTTKSREAYESQQTVYLHRPSSTVPRRPRPQSAGAAGAAFGNHAARTGVVDRDNVFVGSTKYSPSVPRSSSPARGGTGGGGSGGSNGRRDRSQAPFDRTRGPPFVPPPPYSRRVDGGGVAMPAAAATGVGGDTSSDRPGRYRTRVRPSSADARAYGGKPGAGRGVGGTDGGKQGTSTDLPRRVHVPRRESPGDVFVSEHGGASNAGSAREWVSSQTSGCLMISSARSVEFLAVCLLRGMCTSNETVSVGLSYFSIHQFSRCPHTCRICTPQHNQCMPEKTTRA